jgi:DNA-directed RNA polymerase specialized sigma54-like protein
MASFELTQQLVQSLRQEQIMAPQQIQALQILLATIPELEQRITQELEQNPTLEMVDSGLETLSGNPLEDDTAGAPPTAGGSGRRRRRARRVAGDPDPTHRLMARLCPAGVLQ